MHDDIKNNRPSAPDAGSSAPSSDVAAGAGDQSIGDSLISALAGLDGAPTDGVGTTGGDTGSLIAQLGSLDNSANPMSDAPSDMSGVDLADVGAVIDTGDQFGISDAALDGLVSEANLFNIDAPLDFSGGDFGGA